MPDYIGNVAVAEIASSGVFPLVPDFPHGHTRAREVAVHQFGSGNAKIEQRLLVGTGARRFTIRKNWLRDGDRISLRNFWESKYGPYPSARIAYTFERGSKGASEVQKMFDWNLSDLEQRGILRLESIRFRNKSTAQLQAADILAYELYRLLPHMLGSKNRPRRTDILSMLAECKLRSWIALDERELTKFAQVSAAAAAYHGTSRKPRRSGR
jgi:hypothetical protein